MSMERLPETVNAKQMGQLLGVRREEAAYGLALVQVCHQYTNARYYGLADACRGMMGYYQRKITDNTLRAEMSGGEVFRRRVEMYRERLTRVETLLARVEHEKTGASDD